MTTRPCKFCGQPDDRRGSSSAEGPVCGRCVEAMWEEDRILGEDGMEARQAAMHGRPPYAS